MNSLQKSYLTPFLTLFFLIGFSFGPMRLYSSNDDSYAKYWQGVYVSGQMGEGWSQSDLKFVNPNYFNTLGRVLLGSNFSFQSDRFIGGGALGFHYQISHLVLGLEAGALYLHLKKTRPSPFFPGIDVYFYNIQWLANTKAHIGYAYEHLLAFISGGWAGSDVELELKDTSADISAKLNKWVNGWTVGVGVDWKITCYFSIGMEYDYIQQKYNNKTAPCSKCGTGIGLGTPVVNDSIQTQTILARINFYL